MGNGSSNDDSSVEDDVPVVASDSHTLSPYVPKMADALLMIRNIQNSPNCVLPAVLMLEILSYGFSPIIVNKILRADRYGGPSNQNERYLTLHIPPLYRKYLNLACMEFEIVSKDQGWSSYPQEQGTRTSNTWGEVALEASPDERYEVYRNIHAGTTFEKQLITFPADHAFCQSITRHRQDSSYLVIHLYLRSMYPGWMQTVKFASMKVVWQFTEWQLFACDHWNHHDIKKCVESSNLYNWTISDDMTMLEKIYQQIVREVVVVEVVRNNGVHVMHGFTHPQTNHTTHKETPTRLNDGSQIHTHNYNTTTAAASATATTTTTTTAV